MQISLITQEEVRGIIQEELVRFRESMIQINTSSEPSGSPDERLTRQEVCKLYKISYPTLHLFMRQGLPYEKACRKTLFRRSEVDHFFRSKKGGGK